MEERPGFGARLRHAWNAFTNQDPRRRIEGYEAGSVQYSHRPDRPQLPWSSERTILGSIYTRLSVDIAQVDIRHVRVDDQNRYLEDIDSGLNECLLVEANIDQAATAFRQDIALTLINEGVAAIVPVDTTLDPEVTGSWDVKTMRVGTIVSYMPQHVKVSLYNEKTGIREDLTLPKSMVAIVENPLYTVMNAPNSTLQRLIRKLNLLDVVDEQAGSGKLDLIIQLPYVVKSDIRRDQAEKRRKDVEFQLTSSKYGVAYTDGTEKITQLNRPVENKLLEQIKVLTDLLYSQLGLTAAVMDGTAEETVMLNYHNRTIEPMVTAIVEAMIRRFLTKTARSQMQSIMFFRDPFKIVPIEKIAEIVDVFARNEVGSSNELRQVVGWKPSKDPKADELRNSNMPQPNGQPPPAPSGSEPSRIKEGVSR